MKTYIFIRNTDKAVTGVGMIYYKSGDFTKGVKPYVDSLGVDDGIIAYAKTICPEGCTPRLVDTSDLPGGNGFNFDKLFYHIQEEDSDGNILGQAHGWTDKNAGSQVDIEIEGAKKIAHGHRRINRSKFFKQNTDPQVRTDYKSTIDDLAQNSIDASTDEAVLRDALTRIL